MQDLQGLSVPYSNQLLFCQRHYDQIQIRGSDEMDRTAMRVETFLIGEGDHRILLALFGDIEDKHFGVICSNIESIIVYLNTTDVLYLLQFDLPQVLGQVQQRICDEVLA